MNLVIVSRESVDMLLEHVARYFSEIPNRNIQSLKGGAMPFLHHMGRIVIGKLESFTYLELVWQTPSLNASPHNNVGAFIKYLLNSKNKGSFFHILFKKQLAVKAKSSIKYQLHNACIFTIYICITKKGLAQLTDVLKVVYEYLRLLRNMSEEEYETQWDNFFNIEQVNYDMMLDVQQAG